MPEIEEEINFLRGRLNQKRAILKNLEGDSLKFCNFCVKFFLLRLEVNNNPTYQDARLYLEFLI